MSMIMPPLLPFGLSTSFPFITENTDSIIGTWHFVILCIAFIIVIIYVINHFTAKSSFAAMPPMHNPFKSIAKLINK
jgi:hypothetical protein